MKGGTIAGADAGCAGCRAGTGLGFELAMAFQPILDEGTGAPFAFEALVRGTDGQGASWVIDQVPAAGLYAFDQACRVAAIEEASRLRLDETGALLAINFLPNAVYEPEACLRVTLRAAARTGLPLDRLMFEVSERERVVDPAHLQRIFHAYREMGFTTAIDDFGTGHAGLSLLADLRVDVVKLAMELVRGVDADRARQAIIRRTAQLCEDLGIRLVAEGVETAAEHDTLRGLGIRLFQGFLFARPGFRSLPAGIRPAAAPATG